MNKKLAVAFTVLFLVANVRAFILDEEFVPSPHDVLAPSDEHGYLHQMKDVRSTDFLPRMHERWMYYFKAPEQLEAQPAYVAALQRDLKRLGYYCGPIDGYFGADTSDAIARLQKNYSMRVTGTLTDPVRHALHLP